MSRAEGIRHYVLFVNGHLVGTAANDGHVFWQHARANVRYGGTYTPIVQESRIFSPNGYGGGFSARYQLAAWREVGRSHS